MKKSKEIASLRNAFFNSYHGFKSMCKERAFIQELSLLPFVVVYSLIVSDDIYMLYIFSSYVLVLLMECVNTCIETIIDRISEQHHVLSKKAKDIGSFLVMLSIIHLFCIIVYHFFMIL